MTGARLGIKPPTMTSAGLGIKPANVSSLGCQKAGLSVATTAGHQRKNLHDTPVNAKACVSFTPRCHVNSNISSTQRSLALSTKRIPDQRSACLLNASTRINPACRQLRPDVETCSRSVPSANQQPSVTNSFQVSSSCLKTPIIADNKSGRNSQLCRKSTLNCTSGGCKPRDSADCSKASASYKCSSRSESFSEGRQSCAQPVSNSVLQSVVSGSGQKWCRKPSFSFTDEPKTRQQLTRGSTYDPTFFSSSPNDNMTSSCYMNCPYSAPCCRKPAPQSHSRRQSVSCSVVTTPCNSSIPSLHAKPLSYHATDYAVSGTDRKLNPPKSAVIAKPAVYYKSDQKTDVASPAARDSPSLLVNSLQPGSGTAKKKKVKPQVSLKTLTSVQVINLPAELCRLNKQCDAVRAVEPGTFVNTFTPSEDRGCPASPSVMVEEDMDTSQTVSEVSFIVLSCLSLSSAFSSWLFSLCVSL